MKRRAGIVAVHSLDHVALDVPDLEEARRFYTAFGLDVVTVGSTLEVRTAISPRPWMILHEGAKKRLRYVSFGVYEDDLPRFKEQVQALGLPALEPLAPRDHASIWVRDPHGVSIEIQVAPKRTADEAHPRGDGARASRGAPLRSGTKAVRPVRLSHTLLFTPDLDASIAFYRKALGLRISDHGGAVAFLHAPHGSDHHVLAFAKSDGSGFHHVSWVVDSLEDVGIGSMQMAEAGYTRGWGIGRHVLGSNYFYYVRDPWGSYCEYSYDIDYVPVDLDWPAQEQKPEDGFYLWGPPPPEDFVTNFEHTTT